MYKGVSTRGTVGGVGQRSGWARLTKSDDGRPVIVAFGHGTRDSIYNLDAVFPYLRDLHDAGMVSVSLDDSAPCRWGNAAMRADMATIRSNAIAAMAADEPAHVIGFSAGVTAAYNYAKANPTHVASLVGILPCVNIQRIHSADLGGFAAEIAGAYGGAPADADNPADNAATFASIPQLLIYSTNDSIAEASEVTSFAAASGAELVSMGAIGHSYSLDIGETYQPWILDVEAGL